MRALTTYNQLKRGDLLVISESPAQLGREVAPEMVWTCQCISGGVCLAPVGTLAWMLQHDNAEGRYRAGTTDTGNVWLLLATGPVVLWGYAALGALGIVARMEDALP